MLTIDNGTGNSSSPSDFPCCCFVTREEFQAIGTTAVLIFKSIVLVLTSISATLGNLLVLLSIWRTPSLHSPSNALIFGLAVSDLCVGLILEPLYVVYLIARQNGSESVFCIAAVASRFAAVVLLSASLLTVTAVSGDMYLALHLHLRYPELVTFSRMSRVVVGIWVSSITAGLLNIWYVKHLIPLWSSLVLLCLLATTTAYCKVFGIVRHHQAQIQAQQTQQQVQEQSAQNEEDTAINFAEQKKSSITKFGIYALLVVCYLPLSVMTAVLKVADYSAHVWAIFYLSIVLVCFNSTLNPVIYCWRFPKIRAAVFKTAKKILRRPTSSP